MATNLLRTLNSSHARAHPMFAFSALRGPIHATRLSAVVTNPMFCGPRFFSSVMPAPSPTTNVKPTVRPYKQRAKKIRGPYKKTKKRTEHSAASPEHMSASPSPEQEQEQDLMAPKKRYRVRTKMLRAEIEAIPKPPNGATNGYELFTQQYHRNSAIIGVSLSSSAQVLAMWKALSSTERQQFNKEASDINQLRAVAYDKWAEAVGYTSIRKINRDRVLSGKNKLPIPASVRPVRKSPIFGAFTKAKVASGEVSYSHGFAPAMRRASELWRQLSSSQKKVYEAQSRADYEQRLAASSQS
ncbi:hypothetical protein BKA62DRAFT_759555 [Auriculariales sp. MPI-PUGE-AT-0066]|nr:hypothetical protein BKA62DRAFT_759555 [Auriculariales sp. MPI-PUGE-AT-0066]